MAPADQAEADRTITIQAAVDSSGRPAKGSGRPAKGSGRPAKGSGKPGQGFGKPTRASSIREEEEEAEEEVKERQGEASFEILETALPLSTRSNISMEAQKRIGARKQTAGASSADKVVAEFSKAAGKRAGTWREKLERRQLTSARASRTLQADSWVAIEDADLPCECEPPRRETRRRDCNGVIKRHPAARDRSLPETLLSILAAHLLSRPARKL
ncbi:hypothetical protein DL768_004671 [Monosporascus sp. mg162]|nr:hypothetical protein DL768_004671 [Monosporascus sp. mg162]